MSTPDGLSSLDLNMWGEEVGDCYVETMDGAHVDEIDIYTGNYVNGMVLELSDGTEVDIGKKVRKDATLNA